MLNINDGTNQMRTSADYDKTVKAYNLLGHVKNKVISPNFKAAPSRDLGSYMKTEALMNILNDNYRMQLQEE